MAVWELRLKSSDETLGSFVSGDVPVPRLGELVHLPNIHQLVVVNVRHLPASRLIRVYASPMPPSTASIDPAPLGGRLS